MNILLINTNQERTPYPVIPVGLCSVASYLNDEGFCVRVLDLCFCRDARKKVKHTLESFKPDAICLSIRNIDNGEYLATKYYLPQIKDLIDYCKGYSKKPVFIGGPAVNIMPARIKEYLGADFVVVGDAHNSNGFNIRNELFKWISIRDYISYGSTIPIQTKRGCHFSCIYCSYKNIEGSYVRLRKPESVVDEIEELKKVSGAKEFEFVDAIFNNPESHAKDICKQIIKRRLKANFGVACLNPSYCSEELFSLFKEANFRWLICTPESGSPQILANLNKGFGMAEVYNAVCLVKKFKIPTLWAFLVGGPGETMETVSDTLNFIDKYIYKKDIVYVIIGVRIYPNTKMAEIAIDEGIFKEESQLIEPTFYLSKCINETELKNTLLNFSRTHPNFICSYEAQLPLFGLITRLFRHLNIPQPYWRYVRFFNRLWRR